MIVARLAIVTAAALALFGCGSSDPAATTTGLAAAPQPVRPAVATEWGLDATGVQTPATLAATRAHYGAAPAFVGRYVDSGGGPAPLTRDEVELLADHRPRIAIVLVADVYARCATDPSLGLTSPAMGRREADLAAAAANALGVPADGTVTIFQDLEAKQPARADCIAAYADEITSRGYRAGWYGNPIRGQFDAAFCAAAAADTHVARALLWLSQRERVASGPRGAPPFSPAPMRCRAGRPALWQYRRDQLVGGLAYDIDELADHDGAHAAWRP